jgi:pimeloyl-ACP methyl ester carboxylesterase
VAGAAGVRRGGAGWPRSGPPVKIDAVAPAGAATPHRTVPRRTGEQVVAPRPGGTGGAGMSVPLRLRRYGRPPFRVAVLHGGPGAPGYLAPVAARLAARRGVLEPLQRAPTLDGQLTELAELLTPAVRWPVVLVGHSWGAVLGYLFAAQHPELVERLVLVASAPFDERSGAATLATRRSRLTDEERRDADAARGILEDPMASEPERRAAMARVDELFTRADAWDPVTLDVGALEDLSDVYAGVWTAVRALRASGELLALGARIRCPVLAIHGDHDPHPADGVRLLDSVVADFRFVVLERCGHLPWLERHAAEPFYAVLDAELRGVDPG